MQSQFFEEVIKSEYVDEQTLKIANMPSYNPEKLVEERLRESIRQSAYQKQTVQQDDPKSVKAQRYYSYQQAQAWLEQVGMDMQQHRQIVKDSYKILDRRISVSNRSVQNLIVFIKTFVIHERQNAEYLKTKNMEILKLFQDGQIIIYPKLNETIKEIELYDQGNAQKIIELLDGIDKFVREKLDFNIQMFESGISSIRDSYNKAFSQFASFSSKLTKYRRKHQSLYSRLMQGDAKGKDLYHAERKLINTFLEVAKLQKNMGVSVVKLYEEVKKQEVFRFEVVVGTLRMYLDKHVQLSQSKQQKISAQEELIYGLLNSLEKTQVLNACEVRNMFPTVVSQVEKMRCKDNLNVSEFQEFLASYPDTYIKLANVQENHTLIKFKIKNAQIDCGAVLKTWKSCYLIITIDDNILIYLNDNNEFMGKFYVETTTILQKTRTPLIAELKCIKPGFIFDSTKTVLLQLEAQDFDQLHGLLFKEKQ